MSTKKLQILGTSLGNNVYTQPEEPTDAPDGSLWVDTDAEAQSNSVSIDASLTIEGQAADAKATGDAIRSLSEETDPTVPDWAKQPTKPSYTAEEVGALPINTVIPTVPDNVSAFRNDAGYLTEHQDISGKLDASELPTAINTALAQAKASGEFDGADGIGIQSVEQTTTSTEDGGTNVVTVTRTDGTSSTFQIKNGSRGQDATVDASLTQSGKAADAAVVGQRLSALSEEIANLQTSGLTTEQVNALDGMFKVCAFIKADMSAEYNAFRTAFDIEAATITGISATYSGGSVPAGTALSDLTGIVVTATYSDGSTETVTGYTLSGEIAEGNNTITVTYQGKTATFIVTGTEAVHVYTVTNNLTNVTNSNSATTASGYYSATLSAEDGYNINVTITMGGVDITADVYTEDGTILITEVTGDIVITATAELASAYTVLYQLADTPKSVSGLSEDTGITFGAEDANGYTKSLTICVAYTGFDANETLLKMSSGKAVEVTTNAGGSNTKIRVTSCSNAVTVNPEISDSGDYRVIITKEATSVKTLNIHTLSSGAVATVENVGTYGSFSHSACAGNLIVGDSDITVNKLVIYEGILSDAHIATFLSGGDV